MKKPLAYVAVFAILLGFGFSVLFPDCASACSCAVSAGGRAEQEKLSRSEAVFAGEVVEVGTPRQQERGVSSSADPVPVTFEVSEVWKGQVEKEIEVTTASDEGSCGYPFREGESYLVYASEGMQVGLCGGTRWLSDAEAQPEALGAGKPPEEAPAEAQEGGTTAETSLPESGGGLASLSGSTLVALAGLSLVALTASAVLMKRRLGN